MRLLAFAHRAAEGRFGSTASGASNDSTHVHPDSHPFANLPKKRGLSLLGEAGGVGEKDTSRCAASREQCADRKEEGGGGGGGDDECDGGPNNDETNKRGKKGEGIDSRRKKME